MDNKDKFRGPSARRELPLRGKDHETRGGRVLTVIVRIPLGK